VRVVRGGAAVAGQQHDRGEVAGHRHRAQDRAAIRPGRRPESRSGSARSGRGRRRSRPPRPRSAARRARRPARPARRPTGARPGGSAPGCRPAAWRRTAAPPTRRTRSTRRPRS
jgi:hypothetical protein